MISLRSQDGSISLNTRSDQFLVYSNTAHSSLISRPDTDINGEVNRLTDSIKLVSVVRTPVMTDTQNTGF